MAKSEQSVVYLNGLGPGKVQLGEKWLSNHLENHGIKTTLAQIDWYSGESFDKLLDRMTRLTEENLRIAGRVSIVGVSAGGSLAINVFDRIRSDGLQTVILSGRLRSGNFEPNDRASLENRARLHTPTPSQAFADSVIHCEQVIEQLTQDDKDRIRVVEPLGDMVVPLSTMGIDGVKTFKVPALGHVMGIAVGALRLKGFLKDFEG